jgi:environmental stress-induced protein Ves
MRVQRFSEHRAMPWANGKGTSYEVASDRDASDHWSWRIAIAPVVQYGQFSVMPRVDRKLVVIEGNGIVLDVDSITMECLPGQVVQFSGDAITFARLVDGPIVDCGLMTVRGSVSGSMDVVDYGVVFESDVIVSIGQAVFQDENGQHYVLEVNDALLDARGHQIVLQSGRAICIKVETL